MRRILLCLLVLPAVACVAGPPQLPPPDQVIAPTPIEGNGGKYMSAYTSYGTLTEWVAKAKNTEGAAAVGGAIGGYAGRKAAEQIPFIGGILGNKAGAAAAKKAAISSMGGMQFIRDNSDLSFNDPGAVAVYLYATHASHEDFAAAMEATWAIYPDVKKTWHRAIVNAPRREVLEPQEAK